MNASKSLKPDSTCAEGTAPAASSCATRRHTTAGERARISQRSTVSSASSAVEAAAAVAALALVSAVVYKRQKEE